MQGTEEGTDGGSPWYEAHDRLDPPPATARPEREAETARPSAGHRAGAALLTLAAAGWLGLVLWDGNRSGWYPETMQLALHASAVIAPLLLLLLVGLSLSGRDNDPAAWLQSHADDLTERADNLVAALGEARAALEAARQDLLTTSEETIERTEARARGLAQLVEQIERASTGLDQSIGRSLPSISAFGTEAPLVEKRLDDLVASIGRYGESVAVEAERLEARFRETALAAEDANLRLGGVHEESRQRIAAISEAARVTGEELSVAADLAAARADIARERLRSTMDEATRQFDFLHAQGERSSQQLSTLQPVIDALAKRIGLFEQDAAQAVSRLSGAAEQLGAALDRNRNTTQQACDDGERLLLALDSAIRDLDESLPAAIARTQQRLGDTTGLVERLGRSADTAATRLDWIGDNLAQQAAALDASVKAVDGSLGTQGERIAALKDELATVEAQIRSLGSEQAPALLAALADIRQQAGETAERARAEIEAMLTGGLASIGEAGREALESAFRERVEALIAGLATTAEHAARAANAATDQLIRQMAALTENASSLEARVQTASEQVASHERNSLSTRSAQIIAALNDNAIDIAKWLGHDIGQKEWAAYLAGDKSLFSRRAVRLLGGNDVRQVHALYDVDAQFREDVNRYVATFEAMLADILKGRDGNTLAITLLSSDIGKLYVALAQAIERLRVA